MKIETLDFYAKSALLRWMWVLLANPRNGPGPDRLLWPDGRVSATFSTGRGADRDRRQQMLNMDAMFCRQSITQQRLRVFLEIPNGRAGWSACPCLTSTSSAARRCWPIAGRMLLRACDGQPISGAEAPSPGRRFQPPALSKSHQTAAMDTGTAARGLAQA